MPPPSYFSPQQWRDLYRALLRQCSYLPDPIARDYTHTQVVQRFRRYADKAVARQKYNILWQSARRKSTLHSLSLLRRANEGYSKPLEKVLRLSYGRIGKRRRELLATMIAPEVSADNAAVADVVKSPAMFEDGWQPPPILVHLLKAQESHYAISALGVRYQVKTHEPPIPKHNAFCRPVAQCRRRNIRKRWYYTALDSLFPVLPEQDLNILEGLISGDIHWEPVKRRTAVGGQQPAIDALAKFLAEGPKKEHTFRVYASGRPHRITRRFMRRLWRRISCLVPRFVWSEPAQKHRIHWGSMKGNVDISFKARDGHALGLKERATAAE